MKLTTFYKIYYRHRIKKASFVLKIYLIITVFLKYIINLFYLPKTQNLDDYSKENQNLFQNYEKSIRVLIKILKIYPEDKNYFDKLISCYNLSSKDDEAISFLNKFLEKNPYTV